MTNTQQSSKFALYTNRMRSIIICLHLGRLRLSCVLLLLVTSPLRHYVTTRLSEGKKKLTPSHVLIIIAYHTGH